jgi:hypothetical protein
MRDEGGFTLIELLVSITTGIVVLTAILMMTTVATHNQVRIADRVDANRRARPVMTRIVDQLHSGCVAPRVAPVLAGSTPTSMTFITKSGSGVTLTPEKRVLTLSGTTLRETVYAGTNNTPPFTFAATPTAPYNNRTLLTNVSAPPGGVVFEYRDFLRSSDSTLNGTLNPNALGTPLTADDAAHTAYVTVSLSTSPTNGALTFDSKAPIVLSDSVSLRLESAGPVPTQENLPCT